MCWKSNGKHNWSEVNGIFHGWMCECGAAKNNKPEDYEENVTIQIIPKLKESI